MGFNEKLLDYVDKAKRYTEFITNEEMTKMTLVIPLLKILGYDVYNPIDVKYEYSADISGVKKGEKVDIALMFDNEPLIIIETKSIGEDLNKSDKYTQLFRYFSATKSLVGVLTDGVIYKFYTDYEEVNKLDSEPFLTLNLLDLKEEDYNILKLFKRSTFNEATLIECVTSRKYENKVRNNLKELFDNPSHEFIKLLTGSKDAEALRPLVATILKDSYKLVEKGILQEEPQVVEDSSMPINANDTTSLVVSDFNQLTGLGDEIASFKPVCLDTHYGRYPVSGWAKLYHQLFDILYKIFGYKLKEYVDKETESGIILHSSKEDIFSRVSYAADRNGFISCLEEGMYVFSGKFSTKYLVKRANTMIHLLGLPDDYFKVEYSTKKSTQAE